MKNIYKSLIIAGILSSIPGLFHIFSGRVLSTMVTFLLSWLFTYLIFIIPKPKKPWLKYGTTSVLIIFFILALLTILATISNFFLGYWASMSPDSASYWVFDDFSKPSVPLALTITFLILQYFLNAFYLISGEYLCPSISISCPITPSGFIFLIISFFVVGSIIGWIIQRRGNSKVK